MSAWTEKLPWKLRNMNLKTNYQADSVYVILLITVVLFLPSLYYGFIVLDDPLYVFGNPSICGFSIENFKSWFLKGYANLWLPVTMISFTIDYVIWQTLPFGYHLTSLIIHLLNIFLIFKILKRLNFKKTNLIFCVSVFAFHPVQVETVLWISQRKTLLCFFFFLLSFHRFENWLENNKNKDILLSILFFWLSLMSKPLCLLVPVLFCYRYFMVNQKIKHKTLCGILLAAYVSGSILSGWATIFFHQKEGALTLPLKYSLSEKIFTGLSVPWFYLKNVFYPSHLSLSYLPAKVTTILDFKVIFAIVLISIMMFTVLRFRKKYPMQGFWILWIFVFMLPVSNIVSIYTWLNDRYLYIPVIAISYFFMVFSERFRFQMILKVCILCVLAVLTSRQIQNWKSSKTIFESSIKNQPDAFQIYLWSLPLVVEENDFALMADIVKKIERFDPMHPYVGYCRYLILKNDGQEKKGISLLKKCLERKPEDLFLNHILGNYYSRSGKYSIADKYYSIIDEKYPENLPAIYKDRIKIFLSVKDYKNALIYSRLAIDKFPQNPELLNLAAVSIWDSGDLKQAKDLFIKALKIAPLNTIVRNNLLLVSKEIEKK